MPANPRIVLRSVEYMDVQPPYDPAARAPAPPIPSAKAHFDVRCGAEVENFSLQITYALGIGGKDTAASEAHLQLHKFTQLLEAAAADATP